MRTKIFITFVFVASIIFLGLVVSFLYNTITEKSQLNPNHFKLCKEASEILTEVVNAIENYKKQNNKYPETLGDLIPKYINKIPTLPDGFYVYKQDPYKGIDYNIMKNEACQPYSLSAVLLRGSLSSDITVYYMKNSDILPVIPERWKDYKNKIFLNSNWVYCY